MDLNALNQSVLRLIENGTNIISFLKDFTIGSAKDVSITYINADGSESVSTFANIAKMSNEITYWMDNLYNTNNNYSYFDRNSSSIANEKHRILTNSGNSLSNVGDISAIIQIKTIGTDTSDAYTVVHFQRGYNGNHSLTCLAGNGIDSHSSNRPYVTIDDDGYLCWAMDCNDNYGVKISVNKTYGE